MTSGQDNLLDHNWDRAEMDSLLPPLVGRWLDAESHAGSQVKELVAP